MARRLVNAPLALTLAFAVSGCLVDHFPTTAPSFESPTLPPATTLPATPTASSAPAASAGNLDLAQLSVTLEPFTTVKGGPLDVVAPDDGSGRLFIVAQDGRIWVAGRNGKVRPDPMVNLANLLVSGGEQGLLGLALHPGFPTDPRVYVNFTSGTQDVIAALTLDPSDPNKLNASSVHRILAIDDPYANHNGGDLLFGPDGYLYAFFGDGGGGGDPLQSGQNRDVLLGKVLRLDVDHPAGDAAYSSPAGNPFASGGGRPEIWLWGMRNPWRASFDRGNGDLWIGDVGQNAWEEVDVARAGVGALNFGWNRMEGNHCYPAGGDCSRAGLTLPVSEYGHDLGCTVVGGYVYRGSKYPPLAGVYLFADYCTGRIFALDPSTDALRDPVQVGNGGSGISSFGEDTAGELYVTNLSGDVSRVVAASK